MTTATSLHRNPSEVLYPDEANASGVSWPAIGGGAFVSAALSLILLSLGAGLGLSSNSPWTNAGAGALTIGAAAIVWLIAMQIISSSMGGYLAGRLRTKWTNTHDDEVYFRDTAHGFLVWAVGLVITASFLASSATSMAGAASLQKQDSVVESSYFVDTLFRADQAETNRDEQADAEASRILAVALQAKEMAPADKAYLSRMIARRTGVTQPEADKRIAETLSAAREALDSVRKAAAHTLLWMFIALLAGAFCSSYAATIGGRQRDHIRVS